MIFFQLIRGQDIVRVGDSRQDSFEELALVTQCRLALFLSIPVADLVGGISSVLLYLAADDVRPQGIGRLFAGHVKLALRFAAAVADPSNVRTRSVIIHPGPPAASYGLLDALATPRCRQPRPLTLMSVNRSPETARKQRFFGRPPETRGRGDLITGVQLFGALIMDFGGGGERKASTSLPNSPVQAITDLLPTAIFSAASASTQRVGQGL